MTAAKTKTGIGASVTRLEDLPLVTGRGEFGADLSFPNQLHMRVVRSSHAHGALQGVHTQEARSSRGWSPFGRRKISSTCL